MYHGWTLLLFSVFSQAYDLKPSPIVGNIPLKKTTIEISYNRFHKQADWVSYTLSESQLRNCTQRRNNFRPDPDLNYSDSAQLSDYSKSGYDRGHLSPAADNKFNSIVMSESFLLSNISPQPASFNRNIWARLELLVRAWAKAKRGIQVVTGPILENNLPTIGDHVSIPSYYYKVLVTTDAKEAIGIMLPTNANGKLEDYVVPIDLIEEKTKINFMHSLDQSLQDKLERASSIGNWNFQEKFSYYPCNRDSTFYGVQSFFILPLRSN